MCNHDGDEMNDNEFHLCKNSSHSLDGHEDFMNTAAVSDDGEVDEGGGGNCRENYSTLERYFKNASDLSEERSDAWMSIEHRQHFLDLQHHHRKPKVEAFGPSRNFDDTLDIDDDGLIGFEAAAVPMHEHDSCSSFNNDRHEHSNIELISYENNFNLYNSFWWAMGTLIQTTSDLQPKVLPPPPPDSR